MGAKKDGNLTLKQRKFVDTYVENGGNATKACMQIYDVGSTINASAVGQQLLNKPHIKDAINTKLLSMKDAVADKVTELDSMNVALTMAHDDLTADDPKVRAEARKYILDVYKFLAGSPVKKEGSKHVHFEVPRFKG